MTRTRITVEARPRQPVDEQELERRAAMVAGNQTINDAIFRAAGRQPAPPPSPAATGTVDDDEFGQRAHALGCVDVDAARKLIDHEGLAGAALESRLQAELRDRPHLAPDLEVILSSRPAGLDGGARGTEAATDPPTLTEQILRKTGRSLEPSGRSANGMPLDR